MTRKEKRKLYQRGFPQHPLLLLPSVCKSLQEGRPLHHPNTLVFHHHVASNIQKGLTGDSAKSSSVKRAVEDDGLPVMEKKLKLMEIVKEIALETPSSQHEHGENINFRLDKLSSILKCYRDSLVFKSPEDIEERLKEEKQEFMKRM